MKSKVSLIIPVYNVEAYLEKCLDSAVNQTLQDIEIIIVNDGSTDKSLEICNRYSKSDNRIKVITQKNGGLSTARNTGIKAATGEYIAFLDSDDHIEKDMLKTMSNKAEAESLDIVMCQFNTVKENGDIIDTFKIEDNIEKDAIFLRLLAGKYYSVAWANIYKRSLFDSHEIEYPIDLYHEDIPTTYKLFYYANKIGAVQETLYHWLQRKDSISKTIGDKHIIDTFKIYQLTKDFLIEENIYEKYYRFYIRRTFSFTVGLIARLNNSSYNDSNKKNKISNIVLRMKLEGYETEQTLKLLQEYDPGLYNRYAAITKTILNPEIYQELQENRELLSKSRSELEKYKKLLSKSRSELEKIKNSKAYKSILTYRKYRNFLISKNSIRSELAVIPNALDEKKETEKKSKHPSQNDPRISSNEISRLKTLKDKYAGERCFIIGNGPSLNKLDLSHLKNEFTFGVNGIFYKTEEMGFKPTFYMVEDNHVIDDNIDKINAYDPEYKFFPSFYKEQITKSDNTYFFVADFGFYHTSHPYYLIPRFTKDFSKVSYAGQTVTYMNMQLAYYLGFKEVYLIGMDFSYAIRESDEADGATLVSNEDDINHFHPDYFGKGKKWHDPKVERVGWNYEYARKIFEENGRKIYNATDGGKLEIFERIKYDSLF